MSSIVKSRIALIAIIAAFLIPVLIAKLVLENNWYQGAVTNKGRMLVPPIEVGDALNQELPPLWRVGLVATEACNAACDQALYAVNQLDVALGKESGRVTPLFISGGNVTADLEQVPRVHQITDPQLAAALSELPEDVIFVMDPLGNVILHYPIFADEEAMRSEAKNILGDLRNLLKLSKIG